MTARQERDDRGRFTSTRPDCIVDTDEHGHLKSAHGPGWRLDAERRIPAWLWVFLGLVAGWAVAALALAQAVHR